MGFDSVGVACAHMLDFFDVICSCSVYCPIYQAILVIVLKRNTIEGGYDAVLALPAF